MRSKDFWKVKISSPCIKECKIEGVCCTSCGRHQDDIRMWLTYSEKERINIMEKIIENKDKKNE